MEKPVEWVWYGRDGDGESHISLGRWQRHPCQMRYKLAEIQPTEHDRALPTIDTAAIREAALREAAEIVSDFPLGGDGPVGNDRAVWALENVRNAILALIGEKK
jgi:hypothetical protein